MNELYTIRTGGIEAQMELFKGKARENTENQNSVFHFMSIQFFTKNWFYFLTRESKIQLSNVQKVDIRMSDKFCGWIASN